ncbi:MAG: hemerythrin family protein [Gammaproteobacteria bacterium]|nr:hemerythrin family protein [Gammaproteobacteria bacterium]
MTILWRDQMSVGNNSIDSDHRYLICLVNMVELCLQTPEDKEMLMGVFDMLLSYTQEHFSRESKMQYQMKYNRYDIHRVEHQNLIVDAERIRKELESMDTPAKIEREAKRIVTFLRAWLVNHVLKEDMLMRPYLTKLPPDWRPKL